MTRLKDVLPPGSSTRSWLTEFFVLRHQVNIPLPVNQIEVIPCGNIEHECVGEARSFLQQAPAMPCRMFDIPECPLKKGMPEMALGRMRQPAWACCAFTALGAVYFTPDMPLGRTGGNADLGCFATW